MEGPVLDAVILEGSHLEGALRLGFGLDLATGPSILRLEVMDSISLVGIGRTTYGLVEPVSEVLATMSGGVPNDFLITVGAVIPLQ